MKNATHTHTHTHTRLRIRWENKIENGVDMEYEAVALLYNVENDTDVYGGISVCAKILLKRPCWVYQLPEVPVNIRHARIGPFSHLLFIFILFIFFEKQTANAASSFILTSTRETRMFHTKIATTIIYV